MDKDTSRSIKLGLFVTLGIIIFIVGIFLVGARNGLFTKSFTVKAIFANASGLKPGGNVRFDGVKVGIVGTVQIINDSTVEVEMLIDQSKREFITKTAVATITSDGLMGDKMINIISGTPNSPQAQEGDIIKTKKDLNMDAMIDKLSGTNDNVATITKNLAKITDDLNTKTGTIQSLYKDSGMNVELHQTFRNLNASSLAILNDINSISNKIQKGNGSVAEILNDTSMGKNLIRTINGLKQTTDKLSAASDQINLTMKKMNTPDGPLNTLLTDTALSNNVKQSAVNIRKASKTLNDDLVGLQHNFLLRGYFKNKPQDGQ